MSNDLISREALKKHKVYSEERHEYIVPVYNIDNAPTVELLMGRMTNGVIIPIERPTGEWIIKAEDYYKAINERGGGVDEHTPYFVDDIACPKCLAMFSTIDNETERFNCCPNCGAKMKEAENE